MSLATPNRQYVDITATASSYIRQTCVQLSKFKLAHIDSKKFPYTAVECKLLYLTLAGIARQPLLVATS